MLPPSSWASLIHETLSEKNAQNITQLEVSKIFSLADHMIFASGTSARHLMTLCQALEELCHHHKIRPLAQGHHKDTHWIVMDLHSVFVHLFLPEAREYYQLEKLWRTVGEELKS